TAKEQKHKEMLLEYQDLNREVQATIQRRVRSESVHSDLREEGEARQGEDSVQVQLVDQDNVLLHNTTSSTNPRISIHHEEVSDSTSNSTTHEGPRDSPSDNVMDVSSSQSTATHIDAQPDVVPIQLETIPEVSLPVPSALSNEQTSEADYYAADGSLGSNELSTDNDAISDGSVEDMSVMSVSTTFSLLVSHWQILLVAPWGVSWGILKLNSLDLSPNIFNTGLMCIWPNTFTPFSMTLLNMFYPMVCLVSTFLGMPYILSKMHNLFTSVDSAILFSICCELFLVISAKAAASVFRIFRIGLTSDDSEGDSPYFWIYDTNIRLSDSKWLILVWASGVTLFFNLVLAPIVIALMNRRRKKRSGNQIPIIEGLKDGFTWFIVGLLVFRQLLQICVEIIDGGTLQILAIAILLILARLLLWKALPFKNAGENDAMIWSFDINALSYLTAGLGNVLTSTAGKWVLYLFIALSIVCNILYMVIMVAVLGRQLSSLKSLAIAIQNGKERLLDIRHEEAEKERKNRREPILYIPDSMQVIQLAPSSPSSDQSLKQVPRTPSILDDETLITFASSSTKLKKKRMPKATKHLTIDSDLEAKRKKLAEQWAKISTKLDDEELERQKKKVQRKLNKKHRLGEKKRKKRQGLLRPFFFI
ncbi:hypothetical protein ADUPG1_007852, partial [Aduncisulcus paluster]